MTYDPKPIDVSAVAIPSDLQPLLERLAENAHDVWAARRRSEGWTYAAGAGVDAGRKTHPCLVPYADLPEVEKERDRDAVNNTLKAILGLGFRIEKS